MHQIDYFLVDGEHFRCSEDSKNSIKYCDTTIIFHTHSI